MGADIDLRAVTAQGELSNTRLLCSESGGRLLVSIDPKKKEAFENVMAGRECACIGRVSDADILTVSGMEGTIIVHEKVGDLKGCWMKPFGDLV